VAKQRARTNWQLDLKPVALVSNPDRYAAPSENGAHLDPVPAPAAPSPALTKALSDLRANNHEVLDTLAEIRAAIEGLRASVEGLAGRVGAIEAHLAAQPIAPPPAPPAAPRATRPVRETSRALRDSSTGQLGRRARGDRSANEEKAE
jgi:hypothetical protein